MFKWGELVTGANWQWGELTVNHQLLESTAFQVIRLHLIFIT